MNIYNEIWKADENKFSVSRKKEDGTYENENADILLDEQIKADGHREVDLAKNPLIHKVNLEKLKNENIELFVKLLNNYVVNFRELENYNNEELKEINDYLDYARSTKVWEITINHLKDQLDIDIRETFHESLFSIWFKIYTNWYRGRRTDYCTGFEHVFVGEGKYAANTSGDSSLGEISGYHNWIKFLLDEKTGRVNFHGYNYGLNNNEGPDNPNVVTLQMSWNHRDLNGDIIAKLFKPKGGFFVGTSPECELAMGTIAFFENKLGLFNSSNKKQVTIGTGNFNLVLYRNQEENGKSGDLIRSFYPEYNGKSEFTQYIVENTEGDFRSSELIRINNELYPYSAYKSKESMLNKSIFIKQTDWKLKFENWK